MASSSRPAPSPSPAASALQPPSPLSPASFPAAPHGDLGRADLQPMHAIAAYPVPLPHPAAPLHIPSLPSMAAAHPLRHRFSSSPALPPPRGPGDSAGLCRPGLSAAGGGGSPSCRPAAVAPASPQPAPFLTKTYDLVDDTDTDAVISWNASGSGFIVWDLPGLCQRLLPRYFRHSNFASFVRQLNTYGFRKIDPERWEFANDDFMKGKRSLLGTIRRRKPAGVGAPHQYHHHHQLQHPVGVSASGMLGAHSEASILEVGRLGFREELDGLKRELRRLAHQVQHSEGELQTMCQRLQLSTNCEQHMLSFIFKATHDPSFLSQLVQQPLFESSDMPKRQRIAGSMAFSVGGGDRKMDVDCAQHYMQQLDAANHSKMPMPMPLSPYRLALQNEAGLMMAAGNFIGQADQGNSLPTAESQTNQSSGGYGAPAASFNAKFSPRSESSSAFCGSSVGQVD